MKNVMDLVASLKDCHKENMLDRLKKLQLVELEFLALIQHLPKEIIPFLADHSNSSIRQSIATNESIPLIILKSMVYDSSLKVKQALAENSSIDEDTMNLLFLDPACIESLASNTSITYNISAKIISAKNEYHILKLLENHHLIPSFLHDIFSLNASFQSPPIYYGIINHPSTSHKLIRQIFDLNQNNLKERIASSTNINKKMYLSLIKEKNNKINQLLVNNKGTPSWVLFYLYNEYPVEVQKHPNWKGVASELLASLKK